jgi:hypothetical protein
MPSAGLPYVWDYDLDEGTFRALLEGRETRGRLDRSWASVRRLKYASWAEIRRRGLDFLVEWVPRERPDLL